MSFFVENKLPPLMENDENLVNTTTVASSVIFWAIAKVYKY